ncbi:MAG: MFS transporter [Chloroflexi bacterium]|nr:MFS transporter [Chloroflexota bacterium]
MALPRNPLFWAVSLGHFTIDMFNGSGSVLMAFLAGHILQLSNTQIGLAISLYQLLSAVSQPLFGWMADRNGGRWIGAGGVAWTVGMLVLALLTAAATGSYVLMLIPFVLAALGSGALHPVGAMHAADVDKTRAASNTAIFFMMGQMGLALGPALTGLLLDSAATHNNVLFMEALGPAFNGRLIEHGAVEPFLLLALMAIPGVLFMALALPNKHVHAQGQLAEQKTATQVTRQVPRTALPLLVLIVTLRSFINPGIVAFIPVLFQSRGWSAAEYGFITSIYWFASGIAGIGAGYLADRYGSRNIIAVSMILAGPPLFLLATVDSSAALIFAVAAGAFGGGSHSLIVVMAQRLLPGRKGLASGATLGFIFGAGALGTLIIGGLSDQIGLEASFQIVAVTAVGAGLLAFLLPADRYLRPQAPPPPIPADADPAPTPVGAD